jgi:hypothetical protein
LLKYLQNDRIIRCMPTETARYLGSLCREGNIVEVAAKSKDELGRWRKVQPMYAIKTLGAVSENLIFVHECTTRWALNKWPVGINCCVFWICGKKFSEVSLMSKARHHSAYWTSRKSQVGRMINQGGIG